MLGRVGHFPIPTPPSSPALFLNEMMRSPKITLYCIKCKPDVAIAELLAKLKLIENLN